MNLSSTIKIIQDLMRKGAGLDGDAQRIGQLAWMLFLQVFDQGEDEWELSLVYSPKSDYSNLNYDNLGYYYAVLRQGRRTRPTAGDNHTIHLRR